MFDTMVYDAPHPFENVFERPGTTLTVSLPEGYPMDSVLPNEGEPARVGEELKMGRDR